MCNDDVARLGRHIEQYCLEKIDHLVRITQNYRIKESDHTQSFTIRPAFIAFVRNLFQEIVQDV